MSEVRVAGSAEASAAGRGDALVWAFVLLLVLPFHPLWTDFEQVRRGLLLVLAGAVLALSPLLGVGLPRVRGERAMLVLGGLLAASGLVNALAQHWFAEKDAPVSFQWWDAAYRLGQWSALWVVVKWFAARGAAVALPVATALLLTAGFGVVQRLGLGEITGYGTEREPVSVFGNLNVASEWNAVAAMVVAVLMPSLRPSRVAWLAPVSLVLAGAYQVIGQSRAGLIALPVGLCLLALLRRRSGGVLPLCLVLGGAALGFLVNSLAFRPQPADVLAAQAELQRGTKTLDVRVEITKSTAKLVASSLLFGHGPGQFAVLYPTVRSEREIELSSHGRQFSTEVRTAHDDWLELLVDGGVPALVAFAIVLFLLQRAQPDKSRLLPLFVLLLTMLVRAPLGNAPATVAALLLAGVPLPAQPLPSLPRRIVAVVLGLALLALGVLPIAGNFAGARFQQSRMRGEQPNAAALEAAAAWMPFEPRWPQLLAQELLFAGNLQRAAYFAARAIALRPFHADYYVSLGEIAAKGNNYEQAGSLASHALRFDPKNPELRVLLATSLALQQQAGKAIETVVVDPHPQLRARLASTFRSLAQACRARGDAASAARFDVEEHFVSALDLVGHTDAESKADAETQIGAMVVSMQEAGTLRTDARPFVMQALHNLDAGAPDAALQLGDSAARQKLGLLPWQRALIGDKLAPLRSFAPWQAIVGG